MSSNSQTYPKGQTKYLNYEPDEIETLQDAIEIFEWLAEENRRNEEFTAAAIYDDAAEFLEKNFQGDND